MNSITRRDAISAIALLGAGAIAGRISIADEGPEYRPALPGRPSPPRSTYGFESTAEEVTAGMNLSGTTVLVTGCNSGLGLETMRVLALRGAHVYGAARTVEKAETACASVDGSTTPIVVELTDLDSIVNAAEQVRSDDVALDALVLNAGIMALQELEQVRGVEKQFFVNHVGHFLLAEHLMDNVSKARQGRVVVVSSSAHQWAPDEGIQFDNLSGEVGYDPWRAYGQSKLANGLFSRELARRLADTDATSNSLHPGVIRTNLLRHVPQSDQPDDSEEPTGFRWKTIPQGTATQCFVATHPTLSGVTGYYFADCNVAYPSEHMQDDAMAKKLWQVSLDLTADYRA